MFTIEQKNNISQFLVNTDFLGIEIPEFTDESNVKVLSVALEKLESYAKNIASDVTATYSSTDNRLTLTYLEKNPISYSIGSTYFFISPNNFTLNQPLNVRVSNLAQKQCEVKSAVTAGDFCIIRLLENGNIFRLVSLNNASSSLKTHTANKNNPHLDNLTMICPYRVGDIYYTTLETNPSTYWTGTTWEMLPDGIMPMSTTSTTGATGGSRTIESRHMASHTHTTTFTGTGITGHTHTFTGTALPSHSHTFTGTGLTAHSHTFSGTALPGHSHTRGTMQITAYQHGAWNDAGAYWANVEGAFFKGAYGGPKTDYESAWWAQVGRRLNFNASRNWTGSLSTVVSGTASGTVAVGSAGTVAGTISSTSGGTPVGTLTAISSGTTAGTIAVTALGSGSDFIQPFYSMRMWKRLT